MQLLERLKQIIDTNPNIPQYHNIPLSHQRYKLLGRYIEQLKCIVKNDSFCIYQPNIQDPHAQGTGVVMIMTVANKQGELKQMYRQVIQEAKLNGDKWICISHRTAPYTYKHKYYFIG